MIFQKAYRAGIIGSSNPYNALILPCGSNPITDTMLSGNNFEIIHDGAAPALLQNSRLTAGKSTFKVHLKPYGGFVATIDLKDKM